MSEEENRNEKLKNDVALEVLNALAEAKYGVSFILLDKKDQQHLAVDAGDSCKNILQLMHQYGNTRERQGELHQLKMLQHWQNLHNVSIEPEDLQHSIKSLEQFPEQPLARETLDELTKAKEQE